jgi:hypothetical protein
VLSYDFVAGTVTMGFAVAGLFFLRFWRRTTDGLFLAFAAAFWLLALSQALLVLFPSTIEDRSWIYVIRLLAFSTIIVAIFRKNAD